MILDYRIITLYVLFNIGVILFSPMLKKKKSLFKAVIKTYAVLHLVIIYFIFVGYVNGNTDIEQIAKEITNAEKILVKFLVYGTSPLIIYILVTNDIFEKVIEKITIKTKYMEIVLSGVDNDINLLNDFLTVIPEKIIEYVDMTPKECLIHVVDDFNKLSNMEIKYNVLLLNDNNECLEITLLNTPYYVLIFGEVTNIQLLVIDRLLVEFERIYNNLLKD